MTASSNKGSPKTLVRECRGPARLGFVVLRNFLRRFQVRLRGDWSHSPRQPNATERNLPHMTRRPHRFIIASLLAAACLGAGGGAVAFATLHDGGTKTVVKQVTVHEGQPVASSSAPLSVNQIYRKAYRGVVEITVTSNGSGQQTPFGGGSGETQAEGSGWVYDDQGHSVPNEHVVDGATSISVQFWNGKTYTAHLVGSDKTTDLAVLKVAAPSSQLFPLSVGSSS